MSVGEPPERPTLAAVRAVGDDVVVPGGVVPVGLLGAGAGDLQREERRGAVVGLGRLNKRRILVS